MENPRRKTINIDEDRLSNLTGDVIERIMDLLPVLSAARTCVLSSKWRYVWANHPSLVLDDEGFWDDTYDGEMGSAIVVSNILLSHFGHIRKFVLDISNVNVTHENFDLWLSCLCRQKSFKVLRFSDSIELDYVHLYDLPSCVFLASKLTHLSLECCRIKETIGCFNSIQSLKLEFCRINSVVLTTPLLISLSMYECTYHDTDVVFDISAPKLASLTLEKNGFFNLQPFFTCTDIEYVFLSHVDERSLKCVGKHLLDLLALWPKLSVVVVDGYCFELATAHSVPDNDPVSPLNLRRFALWRVDLDCEKIAWIVYVLKNSPFLHTFEIAFGFEEMNDSIKEASIMDFKTSQLRIIKIKGFTASRNEVILVNFLLECAPFLEKMLVEEDKYLDLQKQIKVLKELFLLQKKIRNTEIVFAENLVPFDFSC